MKRDDMLSLGCGKYVENRTVDWYRKRNELYKVEGVWKQFNKRREHYRGLFGGNADLANKTAQAEIDSFLLKREAGDMVSLPGGPVPKPEQAEEEEERFFYNRDEFGDNVNAEIDPIRDLTWIYNNMAVKDVQPSDAPSPGAYAHLKFIQQSDDCYTPQQHARQSLKAGFGAFGSVMTVIKELCRSIP